LQLESIEDTHCLFPAVRNAASIQVGAQNFVLGTDLGQTGNPSPADGLQLFVTDLMGAGLSKDQITMMGRDVTGKLLMG
jgi:hypothetical protein